MVISSSQKKPGYIYLFFSGRCLVNASAERGQIEPGVPSVPQRTASVLREGERQVLWLRTPVSRVSSRRQPRPVDPSAGPVVQGPRWRIPNRLAVQVSRLFFSYLIRMRAGGGGSLICLRILGRIFRSLVSCTCTTRGTKGNPSRSAATDRYTDGVVWRR